MRSAPRMFQSDSDEDGDAQRPALPMPPEPLLKPKQEGPPATAAEYLRLVRQESAALPNIFTSPTPAPPAKRHRSSYLPSPIPPPPRHAKADPQWQRDLVFWFAELQRTVTSLPSADQTVPGVSDKQFWESCFQKRPKLTMLRSMDYVLKLRVLRLIDETVKIMEDEEDGCEYVVPSLVVGHRADWVFCLLSFVQPPTGGEMGAIIRSLLRKVAINMQDMVNAYDPDTASILNVLRTILGKHFRQEDV